MTLMSQERYDEAGAALSEQIRLYREELERDGAANGDRLTQIGSTWAQMRRLAPSEEARFVEDFYLFYALMAAIDVGRPDEAHRVYLMMSPPLRTTVDNLEARDPGKVWIWK